MSCKNYCFIFIILLISIAAFSQKKYSSSFSWDQMRYGGRISLELSNNATSVTLAPTAVYQFNDQFAAGGTVSFGYAEFKDVDAYLFNYGLSILGIYTPIRQIQLSAELEQIFVNETYQGFRSEIKENYNYQALFVGAGYRVKNVVIGLRYDLLYNENVNLYASPYAPYVQVFL